MVHPSHISTSNAFVPGDTDQAKIDNWLIVGIACCEQIKLGPIEI